MIKENFKSVKKYLFLDNLRKIIKNSQLAFLNVKKKLIIRQILSIIQGEQYGRGKKRRTGNKNR